MDPLPTSLPTLVMQQAPAHAWQIWAAFAPLLAAVVAGAVALVALMQKYRADNRAEWWRRAQWGLDASFSDNAERQSTGFAVLEALARSRLAGPEEQLILEEAWREELEGGDEGEVLEHSKEVHDNGEDEEEVWSHG